MYPVQLSCMITGLDHWSWTAYAFIDTYHEDPELGKGESIDDYEDTGACALDPLIAGQKSRGQMELTFDPRTYFLIVLRHRVHQFSEEWNNTVEVVAQKIEDFVQPPVPRTPLYHGLLIRHIKEGTPLSIARDHPPFRKLRQKFGDSNGTEIHQDFGFEKLGKPGS